MADTQNQNTSVNQPEGGADTGNQNTDTQPEKKYSEDDMNNIVKSKSEKAVNKLLKELGITDREKAKAILQKAAESEQTPDSTDTGNDASAQLNSELAAERTEKEYALLEAVFLTEKVNPAKVAKAVKLIDLEDCRDDEGKFDRSKATEAVKALLKDWPELAPKEDSSGVGFKIGSDGQTNSTGGNTTAQKSAPKKSWNRFN